MSSKTTTPASGSTAATKKNGLSKGQSIAIHTSVGIIVLLVIIALIVLLILCLLGKGHDSSSSESSSSSSSSHESSSHSSSQSSSHESSEQSSSHESSEQSSSQESSSHESSEQSSSHESSSHESSEQSSSHESSDQSSSHESSSHESSEQSSSHESSSHESSEQSSSHESSEQSSSHESSSHESSEQSSSHESSEQSSSHESSSHGSSEQSSSHESSEQSSSQESSSHESSEQSSSHESSEQSSSQESSEQSSSHESSEQSSSHESSERSSSSHESSSHESSEQSSSHESSEQSASHESSSSIYSSSLHEVCQETALSQYFLTAGQAILNYELEDTSYRIAISDDGNLVLLQAGPKVAQGVYDSSSNVFIYEFVSGTSIPNEYVKIEPIPFGFAAATTGNVFSSCTENNAYIFVRNDISPINQWVFNVYDASPEYMFLVAAISEDESRVAFAECQITSEGVNTLVSFYRVGPGLYQPDGTFHISEGFYFPVSICFNENGTECMIGMVDTSVDDPRGQVIHLMRTGSSTWVETVTDLPYIPLGPSSILKKDIRNEQASYVYISNSIIGEVFVFRVDNTSKTLEFVTQIFMPYISSFGTDFDSNGFNCINNLFIGSLGNGVTTFSYDGDSTFTFINQLVPEDTTFGGATVSSTRDGERLAVYGVKKDLSTYPYITFYSPEPHHESSSSSAEHYCVGTEIAKYILTEGRTNPEDTPGPSMSSVWMAGLNGEVIFSISDGDIVEVKQGTYHEDINEYVFESFNWYMENDPDEYIDSPAPGYSGFSMDGNHIVTISKSLPHSVYTLRRLEPFPTNLWTFDGLELTDGYEFVIVAMSFYGDAIATVEKADNPYSEYTLIIRFFKLYGETYEQDGGVEFDNSIWNNDDESFTVRAVSVALSEDGLDGSLIVKTGWSSDANFLVVFHRVGNGNWIYHPIFAGNVLINPETLPFMTLIRTDIRTVSVNSPKGLVLFLPNVVGANDLRAIGIDAENGTAFVISIITDESDALDFGTLSMSTSGYNCINYLYVGSLDEGVFAYSFDGQSFSLDTHIVPEYVSELFLRGVSVSSIQDGTKLVVASFVEGLLASPFFTVYSYTETLCTGSFLVNFYESGTIPYFNETPHALFPISLSDDAQAAFIVSPETNRVLVGAMNDQTGEFNFSDLQTFPYPIPEGPYTTLHLNRSSFSSDGNIAAVRYISGGSALVFFRAYQGINEWFLQTIPCVDPISEGFVFTVTLSSQGNILAISEAGVDFVVILTMYDNNGTEFVSSSVLYVPAQNLDTAIPLSTALSPNGDSCVMLSRNRDTPIDYIRFTIARREPNGNWVGETKVSEVPSNTISHLVPSLLRHDKRLSTNRMVYVLGRIADDNRPVIIYDVDTVTFNLFELATIDEPYGVTGFGCTLSSSGGDCLIYLYIGCSDDNGVFIYQFDGVSTFTFVQHVPSPVYLDFFGGSISTTSDGMFTLVSGRTSDPVQLYPFLSLYSSHGVCENTTYSSQFLSQVQAIENSGDQQFPLWVSDDDLNTILVGSTRIVNRKLFQGIPNGGEGGYIFEPLQSVPPEDPFPASYLVRQIRPGFSSDGKYIAIVISTDTVLIEPVFVIYVGTYPGENAWTMIKPYIGASSPGAVAMSRSGTYALILTATDVGDSEYIFEFMFFHRYGLEYINENSPSTSPSDPIEFRSLAINDTPVVFFLYLRDSELYLDIVTNQPTLDSLTYDLTSIYGIPSEGTPQLPSILTKDARIDGDIYIMGAPQINSVYIFKLMHNEEGGNFLALLTSYQDNTKDQFGCSLSISGGNCLNYLYVGSEDSGVTVLSFNGILTFEHLITDDSDPPISNFGRIIGASYSGSQLAVGHLESAGMGSFNTLLNLYTPVTP